MSSLMVFPALSLASVPLQLKEQQQQKEQKAWLLDLAFKNVLLGDLSVCPMVKVLLSNAGGMGSIPVWGTKIPHAVWCG